MKIIKNGKFSETMETTCTFCGCEFTFESEDMHWSEDGNSANVQCPQCKQICRVIAEQEYKDCKPYKDEVRIL